MTTGFSIVYREYWDRYKKGTGPLVQEVRVRVREKYVGGKKVGEDIVEAHLEGMAFREILMSIPLRPKEVELFRAHEGPILERAGLRIVGREGGWTHSSLPVYLGLDGKELDVHFASRLEGDKLYIKYECTFDEDFNAIAMEMTKSAIIASLVAQGQPKAKGPDQGLVLYEPELGRLGGELYVYWPSICPVLRERLVEVYGHEGLYTPEETQNRLQGRLGWPRSQLRFEPGKNLNRGLSFTEEGLAVMPILTKS